MKLLCINFIRTNKQPASQGNSTNNITYLFGSMRCVVGSYLPVPQGFERSECRFFASVRDAGGGDIHGAEIDTITGKILNAKWHTTSINYFVIASHDAKIFSK